MSRVIARQFAANDRERVRERARNTGYKGEPTKSFLGAGSFLAFLSRVGSMSPHAVAEKLTFSEYRTMGGRLIPTHLVMRPADKGGEQTVIVYEDAVFDVAIDKDLFSLPNLER